MSLEQLRRPRIFGLALFDTVGTAIGAYYLAKYNDWPLGRTMVGTFVIGELVHLAFGIKTPVTTAGGT